MLCLQVLVTFFCSRAWRFFKVFGSSLSASILVLLVVSGGAFDATRFSRFYVDVVVACRGRLF